MNPSASEIGWAAFAGCPLSEATRSLHQDIVGKDVYIDMLQHGGWMIARYSVPGALFMAATSLLLLVSLMLKGGKKDQ